ncbi:hypothetical protein [Cellulosilyticum lentocellum]|uniref:Uncharacterized protein n=1 Tax=Cellulosilyticum lentocellum (strain ATCC 49066 / DSM 5427 / NCIMB 11756 / RHM5) TaxID=642492 RepID=F2JPD3_CELLD|nr:hypothetical protein [Cellulosilyticum lentocellum]ADZ82481.1 hypothetical protein Clole_0748 [Cellulosilyticum lentocellum DSM 5427]
MSILGKFSRTEQLKISVKSILKPFCEKVYHKKAPPKCACPYVTYYLKHAKEYHQYDYKLEAHVWSKDVKEAETIADHIEELDNCVFSNEYHNFDIELQDRGNVEDEDKELTHIVVLFNLTYFDVRG